MQLGRSAAAFALLAGAAAVLVGPLAGSAGAAAQAFRERSSFDPTGDVFACQPTDLTVTGGVVNESFNGVQDAQGVFHFTSTVVPHDVTMTDGVHTYTLSGAQWFGGSGTDPNAPVVATDTDHFVIRDASGGVYAKVQVVSHISPNGTGFSFDLGSCEAPSGG